MYEKKQRIKSKIIWLKHDKVINNYLCNIN